MRKSWELIQSGLRAGGGSAGGHVAAAVATVPGLNAPGDDLLGFLPARCPGSLQPSLRQRTRWVWVSKIEGQIPGNFPDAQPAGRYAPDHRFPRGSGQS